MRHRRVDAGSSNGGIRSPSTDATNPRAGEVALVPELTLPNDAAARDIAEHRLRQAEKKVGLPRTHQRIGRFHRDATSGGHTGTQSDSKATNDNASQASHIPVKNMMCAFGVPGYMIHGTPGAGFSVIPVDFSVAPGMYTT